MNKKYLTISITILILLIIGTYFYYPKTSKSNCAKQGEIFDLSNSSNPSKCCEGLKNVHISDTLSIADKCYWTGTESKSSEGICSNCGNNICEDIENVCSCPEDCTGKATSDYSTLRDFCKDSHKEYCLNIPGTEEPELCNICDE